MESDQIVASAGLFDRPLESPVQKIAEQERNAAPPDHSIQIIEAVLDGGALADRLKVKHVTDETKGVAEPLARRNESFDDVRKDNQTDLIVVADRAKSQDGGQLGGHVALFLPQGAESLAGAGIHQQHDGQFPFFDKPLDEGMAHPRRDVPVDVANIVPRLIFPDLLESD